MKGYGIVELIIRTKEQYKGNHLKISSTYWGTDRGCLSFAGNFDLNHPVNQACLSYIENSNECGILSDLALAQNLVQLYESYNAGKFEIFEITHNLEKPYTDAKFIGFDISNCTITSCLVSGLQLSITPENLAEYEYKETYLHIEPLIKVIEKFFKPQLNQYGLFSEYNIALQCFECLKSMEWCMPNYLGIHEDDNYEVIGLWRVNYIE